MSLITENIDLEREYSPSRWCPRFATPEETLQHHIDFVTAESEEAINNIPHKLEIEYGPTPGQKLDILGTDLPDDSPILVFIHGGYWQALSREISRYPAGPLYRSKVKTMVVGFDLCPIVTLPEIMDQIFYAARYIFEYAEKMGSRGVYFSAHCAGATLVGKLLASVDFLNNTPGSHLLQGVFFISGLFDIRDIVHISKNQKIDLTEDLAVALSPQFDCYTHLKERKVRVFIVVGDNESPTFKRQSREYFEVLLNSSLMENMYFEIKDDYDHFSIMECVVKDKNYLHNLLMHDIHAPILAFIHGGFWQDLSREVSRYPAQPLYRFKVKTIVVGYDLCPVATLPEIIGQIQNAVRFVFEYAEKMGSRGVYFAGHSAGAHLVAKLLASADFLDSTPGSNRLQGAFLISGIYDLREVVNTSVNQLVQLPHEWAVSLSPQFDCFTHLQARRVRLYIIAGQHDSPTFKKQSRDFYELLHNTCLMQNMYLEIKDDMDHFDIMECIAKENNYLQNLLIHDIRKHVE